MTVIKMDDKPDIVRVGGKAATLMRLAKDGFNVPRFVTLAPQAFDRSNLNDIARNELLSTLPSIGPGPYAVRSSAVEEDGDAHSHAGQFLSVLNLNGEDVPAACSKVFESAREDHVAGYRETRNLANDAGGTAVLVQQMVNARVAGVAFTADPVSGCREHTVVSAIEGLADKLVGGEANGETYILAADGTVIEGPQDYGVLSSADLDKLNALTQAVEVATGRPQDIEWAFESDELFLLQSRPITTRLRDPAINDTALTIFDNSNIVESYPGLVSPLTYSFAQYAYARVYRAFVRLLGVSEQQIADHAVVFENMLGRIDGRVYYNLVNWYRALALLPGFSINRDHMETMMGVSEPMPAEIVNAIGPPPAKGFKLVLEWGRMSRSAIRLLVEATRLKHTRADFYDRLNNALEEPVSAVYKMPITLLATEYRRIEADLLDKWDAPLINDFLCMIGFGASRKMLEKWAGQNGLEAHNDIMIGQGDIVSAEPAKRIRAMGALLGPEHGQLRDELAQGNGDNLRTHPTLEKSVASYLDKFADRCAQELKLESVTLDRDPVPLFRAIAAGGGGAPTLKADDKDILNTLLAGKPFRKLIARPILAWTKARVRDRENLRFERTRIFGRARHVLRAIGLQMVSLGLLDDVEDIFQLTVQEILGAIEGAGLAGNLKSLVALRRQEMATASTNPDPDERIEMRGAILASVGNLSSVEATIHDDSIERTATGCSAGTVTAKARVISDPRTQALEKGDILVARHTDPGWIAVFANASAIVVERGSLLSHSAIVARELGIPCVVGMTDAMTWITDGETIEVDGASGLVRRIG